MTDNRFAGLSGSLLEAIGAAATGVDCVQEVRALHVRQRGSWYLADLRIAVHPDHTIATAHDTRRTSTLLGRIRQLPDIASGNRNVRQFAERTAINTPIQGSAADLIKQAILHEGFSVVEILSQCPTHFGRKNKQGAAADMMERYKDITVPVGSKKKAENPDLIERGIFVQEEAPEYCREYDKIIEKAMKG